MTAVRYLVEVEVQHGQRLQTLDEAVRVVVEDDTLVQQALGVEDGLQLTHDFVGLVAPLVLHKRCHVPTCAMLGLQRSVVALYHEFGHRTHHLSITGHLVLVGKALVQDEVVVALKGMTVDAGIVVAVVGNELLQLHRGLRQRLDGERHILNETRGTHGTRATYTGEDTRTDGPVFAIHCRILRKLSRDIQAELPQTFLDLLNLLKQLLVRHTLCLRQDSRQVVIVARFHTGNLSGIDILLILQVHGIVHTAQRLVVEHLGTLHHQLLGTHLQILVAGL